MAVAPVRPLLARRWFVSVLAATLLATATVALVPGSSAVAAPIDDTKAQAAELEAQINANAERAAELNEQMKYAQQLLDEANAQIAESRVEAEAARAEIARLKTVIRDRAASAYTRASSSSSLDAFTLDPSHYASRQQYVKAATQRDTRVTRDLQEARIRLATRERSAQAAADEAQQQRSGLAAMKSEFDDANTKLGQNLAKVQGEHRELVAQAEAARRAAQAPPPSFNPVNVVTNLPPASGRGGAAVTFAVAQLGKPYVYAGVGPDSYDCSGLTMAAWAAAGVSLPHNSEAQYAMFAKVPMNQLQPGDVLWGPGHVGIYVGGGAVIHAPRAGTVVGYIGVGYFQGAVRPG